MLLTLQATLSPGSDLGYLLHKHPARVQSFSLPFGQAHVFYPEVTEDSCTAALLLDVDPVRLARGGPHTPFPLKPYVNDRPYVASSFLSVALARVFGSALAGTCKDRPDLAETPLPLRATLSALPGGEELVRRLFEPLGYDLTVTPYPLDPAFPEWGGSPYATVTLRGTRRLSELLRHLYVLVPVLDDEKHYWVGDEEVEKLLRRGEGWLAEHPERETVVRRALKHQRHLVRGALAGLGEAEAALEPRPGLHEARLGAVASILEESGATRVLDLGCGEGRLLERLLDAPQFAEVVGADVSPRALGAAQRRLEGHPARARLRLLQSSLLYRDARLAGYDAAALVEVLEHVAPARLGALERALFTHARPALVIVTTPNREYNRLWPLDGLRHPDHRFEWDRAEFRAWAERVAGTYGYEVTLWGVGPEDPAAGAPTQMGVFRAAHRA